MTLYDALQAGYSFGDVKHQRGYVSRKADSFKQPVMKASGRRKGQLYVLLPCPYSTQYCFRQYLKARRPGAYLTDNIDVKG